MIAFFAKHPTAANLLMFALLAMGILSLKQIRRETFPDFEPREVEIRVPYPGATAEDVEDSICQRIEDAVDGVRFVAEVRSDARQNLGVVTVEMVQGGDWLAFKDEIDTAVAAIDDFPEKAEEPTVNELHTTDPVMSVLVSGQMTPGDLKLYAENLKDRMQETPGISLIEIQGFSDHQLRVELSANALQRYDVSPSDVARAIRDQSVEMPAGVIEARQEEVLVRFSEERTSAEELADLVVIAGNSGSELRVRDLGTVVDDFEIQEDKIIRYLKGKSPRRAAVLQIKKTDQEDALTVSQAVRGFLEEEKQRRPAVDLEITQDTSTLTRDRLQLLITNGWQGMILVFLAMWLFFNFKLSFWVVASLPVSFLAAFFIIPQLDISINMLSMVALLLALGILMDDGIVIAENIAAHAERGKSPMQASVDGVSEVAPGVMSSFLTTVCMLGPLAFLDGTIGRVLEVVPIVLLVVLGISLVEAFLILPHHLAHSIKSTDKENKIRQRINKYFDHFRNNKLGQLIDFLIRWRYPWIGTVIAIFLLSLALPASGVLQFQALPELDGDTAVARVLMPQGTPLAETEKVVNHLVAAMWKIDDDLTPDQPKQQPYVKTIYARYNENTDAFEPGPHVVTIYVDLLAAEVRTARLDHLFALWHQQAGTIPDAVAVNYSEPNMAPTGRNIEVRTRGGDLHDIRQASLDSKAWLSRFPGVKNLTTDLRPGRREFLIRFRPGALEVELDSNRMANQLRAAFQGEQATEIQVGSESYEIEARFDSESQNSLQDLLNFRFTLPDGTQAPLSSVATVTETQGWARIARIDRIRTASLRGDVDSREGNTAAILREWKTKFLPELQKKYPELKFELSGETEESETTAGSFVRALIIGLIGIFILLSFQFESYLEPLIVMAAIPFALIGVIWGHLLMGYPLTMPSMLGFISLAGVVVNDSILLVLFLKMARKNGADPVKAAGQASRERFRAILITSLTTMAGLIPLTFETSLQAVMLIPLAISIVFGIFASTLLVLLVIPCLYVMLDDFGLTTSLDMSHSTDHDRVDESLKSSEIAPEPLT